jgi:hypothetical protein
MASLLGKLAENRYNTTQHADPGAAHHTSRRPSHPSGQGRHPKNTSKRDKAEAKHGAAAPTTTPTPRAAHHLAEDKPRTKPT